MTGLTRPMLYTVPDEPGQRFRMAAFAEAHPAVMIRAGTGYWQARIPESNGETIITRYLLRDLLDKLAELLP